MGNSKKHQNPRGFGKRKKSKHAPKPAAPKPAAPKPTGACSHFPPRAVALSPVLLALAFVRAARELLLPLHAAALGMAVDEIGLYAAASFGVDTALVPLAGYVTDKYGRRVAGVPSLVITACGLLLLAYSQQRANVLIAAIVLGLGNGISNGWIQTVGADVAPAGLRPQFLGLWNLLLGLGTAVGPAAAGAVAEWFSLPLASIVAAAVALFGAAWYLFVAEETLVTTPVVPADVVAAVKKTEEPKPSPVSGPVVKRVARSSLDVTHGRGAPALL
jgi:MFS family permease